MIKRFLILLALLLPVPATAEDQALAELFSRQGVEATMVVSSLRQDRTFVHNDTRAAQRFPVASTFKILNTLISLEEKAIAGKDDVLKWDGQLHDIADWNRDHTLESAFRVSCVWCYQELARRVGAEKYRSYLHETAYGELAEPFRETTFWLDGSLQISAMEQVGFLKKLYRRQLPFSAASYETLGQIMLVDRTPAFALWAKTGWATSTNPRVGWYVGYVETPGDVWFFAMNMVAPELKDLPLRQQLTREALRAKGIIE